MTGRPQQFRLGAMRERITIQTATETTSDAGDVTPTWADTYANEPAKFDSVSGGETLRGKQVEAGINAVFTVHYRSTFTPKMRVVHNSNNYGIVYIKQIEGGRRYSELWCKVTA